MVVTNRLPRRRATVDVYANKEPRKHQNRVAAITSINSGVKVWRDESKATLKWHTSRPLESIYIPNERAQQRFRFDSEPFCRSATISLVFLQLNMTQTARSSEEGEVLFPQTEMKHINRVSSGIIIRQL